MMGGGGGVFRARTRVNGFSWVMSLIFFFSLFSFLFLHDRWTEGI